MRRPPFPRRARRSLPPRACGQFFLRWLRRILVFWEFSFCFVLFAASLYGASGNPYAPLFSSWNRASVSAVLAALSASGITGYTPGVLAAGSALVFAVEARGSVSEWIRRRFFLFRWALYAALALALLFFGVFGQSAFIYQQY